MKNDGNDWYEARERAQIEISAKWIDMVWRIADALEHQVMLGLPMMLAAYGKVLSPSEIKVQHRADCPGCAAIRTAKSAPNLVATGNGGLIR